VPEGDRKESFHLDDIPDVDDDDDDGAEEEKKGKEATTGQVTADEKATTESQAVEQSAVTGQPEEEQKADGEASQPVQNPDNIDTTQTQLKTEAEPTDKAPTERITQPEKGDDAPEIVNKDDHQQSHQADDRPPE